MRSTTLVLLVAAAPCVSAFFEELFGGGGGQFQQQRQPQVRWPNGIPQEISKGMQWLKGTEWQWNREQWTLKLQKSGDVEAPIQQCQQGTCKWSAEKGILYILLGDAGLLQIQSVAAKPEKMQGMKMVGKIVRDGQKVSLTFQKIFDHSAVDLDKDLYGDLGLPDDASEIDIKKVYRKLSIKYHPDKNPDEASRALFAKVRDAYEILNDPDKKILYDTGGMESVAKADKGEIEKTDDFESNLDVTLDELYLSSQKQANIQRRIVCRGCRLRPDAPQCRGCGRCPNEVKVVNVQMGPFMTQQQQEVPSKEKCKQEQTGIDMEIEKGMREGDKLTFPRMADQRPGMLPGAVNIQLKVKKHAKFVRKGNDLHMDIHLSLSESLLGWTQTIRHMDGRSVELKVDGVTKYWQVIEVTGEGMPLRDDPASFGNLYIKCWVKFPNTITDEQRELVSKMFTPPPPRAEL